MLQFYFKFQIRNKINVKSIIIPTSMIMYLIVIVTSAKCIYTKNKIILFNIVHQEVFCLRKKENYCKAGECTINWLWDKFPFFNIFKFDLSFEHPVWKMGGGVNLFLRFITLHFLFYHSSQFSQIPGHKF